MLHELRLYNGRLSNDVRGLQHPRGRQSPPARKSSQMNIQDILIRLRRENACLKRERYRTDATEDIRLMIGRIWGMTRAIKIVEECDREERLKHPELNGDRFFDFERACATALHYLTAGEPGKAKHALKRVLEKAQEVKAKT